MILLTEAKHIGNKNENSFGFDVRVSAQQKEEPVSTCIGGIPGPLTVESEGL